MQENVKSIVAKHINDNVSKTDKTKVTTDDVFIVWFCKTLQNWKALAGSYLHNGLYFEVTHNGDKSETYLDVYKKTDNIVLN